MRVLTGHCVEMSGAPPYVPYVEMIEQALSNPRSPLALREALGDVAPEIAVSHRRCGASFRTSRRLSSCSQLRMCGTASASSSSAAPPRASLCWW